MKIDCITVSVDYTDYLVQCLDNIKEITNWYIITHPDDIRTINLCKENGLHYITTNLMYADGASFAKGRCINYALSIIKPKDWVLQLDSDIKLPSGTRAFLEQIELSKDKLYCCRRAFNRMVRIEINPKTNEKHLNPMIGFFQLWHSDKFSNYPSASKNAGDDDETFARRFDVKSEQVLLDYVLEDVSGVFCSNWYGRKKYKQIRNCTPVLG